MWAKVPSTPRAADGASVCTRSLSTFIGGRGRSGGRGRGRGRGRDRAEARARARVRGRVRGREHLHRSEKDVT